MTDPKIIKAEPKAWIRKYLRDASEEYWFLLVEIKGINAIRFNSNPHHAPNQESDDIDKRTPLRRAIKKKYDLKEINTKKREFKFSYMGYEPISLISLSF